jgi:hypothetical protein
VVLPTQKTPAKRSISDFSILVHGASKMGKSTFCSKGEKTLFLATEPGLNSLEVYQVPITGWKELVTTCAAIAAGGHEFKTIVIDTIDNAYRMCADYICAKFNIDHESDLGYGKGFALVNSEFHRVLTKLAFLPHGLILVSHSCAKEIETRTGRRTRIVPTLPEKARQIAVGLVDVILFCDFDLVEGPNGKKIRRRVIRTKPTDMYDAGDRTGRLPDLLPLDYQKFVTAFENAGRPARQEPNKEKE